MSVPGRGVLRGIADKPLRSFPAPIPVRSMRLWPEGTGDHLRRELAFLVDSRGYELISDNDGGMGGVFVYRSPQLWITAFWDRSDPSLELSPVGVDLRVDWDVVDRVLRGDPRVETVTAAARTAPPAALGAYLREHLAEIEMLFHGSQRAANLAMLSELQAERQRLIERT